MSINNHSDLLDTRVEYLDKVQSKWAPTPQSELGKQLEKLRAAVEARDVELEAAQNARDAASAAEAERRAALDAGDFKKAAGLAGIVAAGHEGVERRMAVAQEAGQLVALHRSALDKIISSTRRTVDAAEKSTRAHARAQLDFDESIAKLNKTFTRLTGNSLPGVADTDPGVDAE